MLLIASRPHHHPHHPPSTTHQMSEAQKEEFRLIREREAMEAYKERARIAVRAREGDADAAFADDDIHPDDEPDEVVDPVEAGVAALEVGVAVEWQGYPQDGELRDEDGILMIVEDEDGIEFQFQPMEIDVQPQYFQLHEFFNMEMQMGSSDDGDILRLTFKENGEYVEMSLRLFDQSIFVNVAYALLDLCPTK